MRSKLNPTKSFHDAKTRRHFRIIDEIGAETDRGAALISVAYLEERLAEAIRAGLTSAVKEVKVSGSTVEKRLFEGTGPFATLSAKIDHAFGLGFYGTESHRELHLLRKIRNKFAHSAEPLSFNSSPVADWCKDLRLPEWIYFPSELEGDAPKEPRDRFVKSFHVLFQLLWTEMVKKNLVGDSRAPDPAPALP